MSKKQVNLDIQIKTEHNKILEKAFNDGYYSNTENEALCILKAFGLTGKVEIKEDIVNIIVTEELVSSVI